MKNLVIFVSVLFFFCSSAFADTKIGLSADSCYVYIDSEKGSMNIRLIFLVEAISASISKNIRGGELSRSDSQKEILEKIIAHLSAVLKTQAVSFDWPIKDSTSCVLRVKEGSSYFCLNLYPVVAALKVYFEKGLLRPGMERRIEESLANGFLSYFDRYSSYWNKLDAEMRMAARDGYIKSVGVILTDEKDGVFVTGTFANSPAEKAGIVRGDKIVEVGGTTTLSDDALCIARKLWGEIGTRVSIRVLRAVSGEEATFFLQRVKIEIQSVSFSSFKKDDDIFGFLKIDGFNANTNEQYDSLLHKIVAIRPKYLIIDLRENRGGYVHIVQDIQGRIIDSGVFTLTEEDSSGKRNNRYSRAPYRGGLRGRIGNRDLKMICLVSSLTASGGEVLASTLRDAGVQLVGERTYGKGVALIPTHESSGDGYYYNSEWRWLTSRGVCIEGIGISPDIFVDDYRVGTKDPVLERAIEEILKK